MSDSGAVETRVAPVYCTALSIFSLKWSKNNLVLVECPSVSEQLRKNHDGQRVVDYDVDHEVNNSSKVHVRFYSLLTNNHTVRAKHEYIFEIVKDVENNYVG